MIKPSCHKIFHDNCNICFSHYSEFSLFPFVPSVSLTHNSTKICFPLVSLLFYSHRSWLIQLQVGHLLICTYFPIKGASVPTSSPFLIRLSTHSLQYISMVTTYQFLWRSNKPTQVHKRVPPGPARVLLVPARLYFLLSEPVTPTWGQSLHVCVTC